MNHGKILCVDDEPNVLSSLKRILKAEGFDVLLASSGSDALAILEKEICDITLVDYQMPEMNGIELIKAIKDNGYNTESIMLTGYGDVSLIVQAIKEGAYDYILKPWNDELLIAAINRVLNYKSLEKEKRILQDYLVKKYKFDNLIGTSQGMKRIYSIIEKVKDIDNNVLIIGESGTGKEQIARAIHFNGIKKDKLFIPVDCISINPNIIESELFGHVKGAFTGAYQDKEGLLKSAGKGTIFLDEIAEIPLNIQAKLLRVLQEMEIKPVGSTKSLKIEARIISATNKDLSKAVENGEFRKDLFYRLNVITIDVPPLRDHKEDIPLLVNHFIKKFNSDKREIKGITPEALEALMNYNWPGNIRQLEHCIERAFIIGTSEFIDIRDLSKDMIENKKGLEKRTKTLKEIEYEHIIKTIQEYNGDKENAAKALGIGKSTLYEKIKKYNVIL